MTQYFENFWLRVSPIRAVLECVLVIVLVNAVLSLDSGANADSAAVFASLTAQWLCAAYAAARIRIPEQSISAALIYDILSAIGLTVALGTAVYGVFVVLDIDTQLESIPRFQLYFLLNIGTAFLYLAFRLLLRLWRLWSVVRRRRLRWAITNTHVITVLAVMVVALMYLSVRGMGSDNLQLESPVNRALLSLVSFVALTVVQFIVAIPIVAAVMALAVAISYRASKPITTRIENLAAATSRLRDGDYTARLEKSGSGDDDEDEIALLENNFNAMAAELEKALTALQRERDTVTGLLQNQRELTASVSHELRTPIAVIRGNLEALQSDSAEIPAEIQTIEREVMRLQTLIEDLFTLSRAEVGQLTLRCAATEIKPVIEHVVNALARQARERAEVKLIAKVPENLPPVLIDAGRLEQILSNLVQNAVRHTLPGGLVVIEAAPEDTRMLVSVHDTGQGIPPDDLPHIWNRFYRGTIGNTGTPGTGLGLAVVKQLTEAMDGTVEVESVVGQGSRFDLRFPLA